MSLLTGRSTDFHSARSFVAESPKQRKTPKDLTERVFLEAAVAQELTAAKAQFEEENHLKRLELIKKRLQEDRKDCWRRQSVDSLLGLQK